MTDKTKRILWIASVAVGFFLFETLLFFYVDRPLAVYTHALDASAHDLIDFFRAITDLGKAKWYLWPCGLAALFCGFLVRGRGVLPAYRRLFAYVGVRAFFLFATLSLSGILADIVKPFAGRARPRLWLDSQVFGFDPFNTYGFLWNGMPSGHTTTAVALACSLSVFYPRLRVLWFAFALLIAASRVMVDAHYLSDVCAGAMLGWLTVRIFVNYGMIHVWKVIFPIDGLSRNK